MYRNPRPQPERSTFPYRAEVLWTRRQKGAAFLSGHSPLLKPDQQLQRMRFSTFLGGRRNGANAEWLILLTLDKMSVHKLLSELHAFEL